METGFWGAWGTSMPGRFCVLCAGSSQGFAAGFRLNRACVCGGAARTSYPVPQVLLVCCPKRGPKRNAIQKFFFFPLLKFQK
jgi:hypothetical protein